ncbi:hypothetical protein Celaphus_00008135, partial [Cervus elaphus hippelaphus]
MEDAKAHLLEGQQNKKKDRETSSAFINIWRIKKSSRPAFGKSLYIPNHENPAKDYRFLTLSEVQEKELRMAEGEEGM